MWDPEHFPGADNVPWQLLIRARSPVRNARLPLWRPTIWQPTKGGAHVH